MAEIVLTMQEKYDCITNRLQKPENRERYNQLMGDYGNSAGNGSLSVLWHHRRMKESLQALSCSTQLGRRSISLYKSDFNVSLRAIIKYLDTEGWA